MYRLISDFSVFFPIQDFPESVLQARRSQSERVFFAGWIVPRRAYRGWRRTLPRTAGR